MDRRRPSGDIGMTGSGMAELQNIETGGLRLAWREAGEGEPVIFLHGIGAMSQGWRAQLSHFAGRYRAIAWDAPGYGGSGDLAAESPQVGAYAEALASLLTALGVERAHLVGNSLGALMAAAFWRRHPGRVRSMVLSDAATGHGKADPAARDRAIRARLDPLEALGPAAMAAERAGLLVAPGTDPAVLAEIRDVMAGIRPGGYRQATLMLAHADIVDELAGCDSATLVLCGTEDKITPEASNRRIADSLANGRYEPMAGLGHLPYAEAPDRFNDLVGAYLDATP